MPEAAEPDFEDGATEEVAYRPSRYKPVAADLERAVAGKSGGSLRRMQMAAEQAKREFIIVRGPMGVQRIALSHAQVLSTLWRLWSAKRVERLADPGVRAAEVVAALPHLPGSSVRSVLSSLIRSGAARSIVTHLGFRGTLARYFPTESGIQLVGLVSVLPLGSSVQVGRNSTAWKSRSRTEPANLFQHAKLLRGGGGAPPDLEFT